MRKGFVFLTLLFYNAMAAPKDERTGPKTNISLSHNTPSLLCRDRTGYFHSHDFRVSACTMCFVYLFPSFSHLDQFVKRISGDEDVVPVVNSIDSTKPVENDKRGVTKKNTRYDTEPATMAYRNFKQRSHGVDHDKKPSITVLRSDVIKKENMEEICRSLTSYQCQRWQQCCQAANQCCDRQIKQQNTRAPLDTRNGHSSRTVSTSDDDLLIQPVISADHGNKDTCPITWDGYSCVQDTLAGASANIDCPPFISLFKMPSTARATRRCLSNATWWKSPVSHLEWTDYSKCIPIDFESMKVAQILSIVCNCVSIACVVPSLLIFILLRPLRRQPRIQLHISMFVAMLMSAIFGLIWERLVIYDMLVTPLLDNFTHTHPNVCRFLNMAARLSDTFTFFWMFCQGFHLQWLVVRSFKPLRALSAFSLIGWGIPSLLVVAYTAVRLSHFNDDPCWIQSTGAFEWIIDGPAVACIVLNLVFLAIILRALWNQLEAHPDDIGPVRRTVRALFLLIPLFGLQQFFILYRPHLTDTNYVIYDVTSAIIVNSQGTLVAVIFCFMNEEVQIQVKIFLSQWFVNKVPHQHSRHGSISATHIQMTTAHRPSVVSSTF